MKKFLNIFYELKIIFILVIIMLNEKVLGVPLWVLLVIIAILFFSCNKSLNVQTESKEKFTTISKPKIKVMNFNTEWCGWSRRFQPEWNKLTEQIKANPSLSHIDVIDVKCDNPNNEQMCEKYQVPGYPFVVIEANEKRTPYNGERTANAIIETLRNM